MSTTRARSESLRVRRSCLSARLVRRSFTVTRPMLTTPLRLTDTRPKRALAGDVGAGVVVGVGAVVG